MYNGRPGPKEHVNRNTQPKYGQKDSFFTLLSAGLGDQHH
jgi:hypothetical protein